MTNKLIILFFVLLLAFFETYADDRVSLRPEQIVEHFHEKLLYVMKNSDSLGYHGRRNELAYVIPETFNISLIAQVILGRYWLEMNETQKADFIALYNNLIVATYAGRFDGFSGEIFDTKSIEELNRGRKLIKTELTKINGESVTLDYLMSEFEGKWMIISVIANGANDISIKRGEYSDVIKNSGYDSLLEQIQSKINDAAD